MQHQRWTHKIACLGMAALMALTAGTGLASSDAASPSNAWTHSEALHAGKLALSPMETAGVTDPLSLSPDGTRALAWQDGVPVVVSLADGTVTSFWKAADGLPAEIARMVEAPPKALDPLRVSWSFDGKYIALSCVSVDTQVSEGPTATLPSGLLWLADLTEGTIKPLKDARISTPDVPAYFTNVNSVAFHPSIPVLYFVASEQTLLSRLNPLSKRSTHTMMFHYSYEDDSVSMMETVSDLPLGSISPVQCDGGTLALTTASFEGAALLALVPMHAIARMSFDSDTPDQRRDGQSILADLHANTALLIAPAPKGGQSALTTVPLPELLPLEAPEDPELPVVPKKSDFGKPKTLDAKGLVPQAAAFSPAGECVAALGLQEGKLALSILELDSGKVGSVDLSALNLPEAAEVTSLQWAGSDRVLIRTTVGTLLCTLVEK